MSTDTIRIGTVDDALGQALARAVVAGVTAKNVVATEGVFLPAGEQLLAALINDECDVVAIEAEDLPIEVPPGVTIAAIPQAADVRDAVCARDGLTLDSLPAGARVGVSSRLREAKLRARRADLEPVGTTGDGPALVESGELDAVIVSAASLFRVNRLAAVTDYLGIDGWPTAPGQGAIAVLVRTGDEALVTSLEHSPTRMLVEAQRQVAARLSAVTAPLGSHALAEDGMLFLSARVIATDGTHRVTSSHALYVSDAAAPAAELAERVATELLELGAGTLL